VKLSPARDSRHKVGDTVRISTDKLGTLMNRVTTSKLSPPWTFGLGALMHNLAGRGLLKAERLASSVTPNGCPGAVQSGGLSFRSSADADPVRESSASGHVRSNGLSSIDGLHDRNVELIDQPNGEHVCTFAIQNWRNPLVTMAKVIGAVRCLGGVARTGVSDVHDSGSACVVIGAGRDLMGSTPRHSGEFT